MKCEHCTRELWGHESPPLCHSCGRWWRERRESVYLDMLQDMIMSNLVHNFSPNTFKALYQALQERMKDGGYIRPMP